MASALWLLAGGVGNSPAPTRAALPVLSSPNLELLVLWIAHTGSFWRDLPECFGRGHSIYMRYHRWSKKGIWQWPMTRTWSTG
ncbi:transposase [Thiorhodospira sibirica]|uniref:transposase n=1 Tax=Thiorhodospira sibirica TaxID=154347 RepID=UPI000A04479C